MLEPKRDRTYPVFFFVANPVISPEIVLEAGCLGGFGWRAHGDLFGLCDRSIGG